MAKKIKWIFGFAALVAGLCLVLAAHLLDVSSFAGLSKELFSSLHAPGFGLVSVIIMLVLRRRHSVPVAYLGAAVATSIIGLFAEIAQISGPRSADFLDLVQNTVGIVAFLGCAALLDPALKPVLAGWRRATLGIAASVLLVLALAQTTTYAFVIAARSVAAPRLIDFDTWWEYPIYSPHSSHRLERIPAPPHWPTSASRVAHLNANKYNRLLFRVEPFQDWSEFKYLSFYVGSASNDTYSVSLVIRDTWRRSPYQDNRFMYPLTVGPEPTHVRIPIHDIETGPSATNLDIDSIGMLYIFAPAAAGNESIYISDLKLE